MQGTYRKYRPKKVLFQATKIDACHCLNGRYSRLEREPTVVVAPSQKLTWRGLLPMAMTTLLVRGTRCSNQLTSPSDVNVPNCMKTSQLVIFETSWSNVFNRDHCLFWCFLPVQSFSGEIQGKTTKAFHVANQDPRSNDWFMSNPIPILTKPTKFWLRLLSENSDCDLFLLLGLSYSSTTVNS